MRGGLAVLAAGALMCAPAASAFAQGLRPTAAELTAQIAAGGTWDFQTRDRSPDGKPVCTETWTFRADGSATVISGQQTVEKTWRAAVDGEGLQWLYTNSIMTTAGPDCMGQVANPADYPRPESGFVLLMFNSGVVLTCEPPQSIKGSDGKPSQLWTDEGCWGNITPRTRSGG